MTYSVAQKIACRERGRCRVVMSGAGAAAPLSVAPGSPRAAHISAEMRGALASPHITELRRASAPLAMARASAFGGLHVVVPTAPFYAVFHAGEELPAHSSSFAQMLECWTIIETLGRMRETPEGVATQKLLDNMGVVSIENDVAARSRVVRAIPAHVVELESGAEPTFSDDSAAFADVFSVLYDHTVSKLRLLESVAMIMLGVPKSVRYSLLTPSTPWQDLAAAGAGETWFGVGAAGTPEAAALRRLVALQNQRSPLDRAHVESVVADLRAFQQRAAHRALRKWFGGADAGAAASGAPAGVA